MFYRRYKISKLLLDEGAKHHDCNRGVALTNLFNSFYFYGAAGNGHFAVSLITWYRYKIQQKVVKPQTLPSDYSSTRADRARASYNIM